MEETKKAMRQEEERKQEKTGENRRQGAPKGDQGDSPYADTKKRNKG